MSVRLTDHIALADLGKLHAAARSEHYRLTLPSADDGFRLLPCGREMEHSQIMRDFADKHEVLKRSFLADYAGERAQAPIKLNGLFVAAQWPDESTVDGKFGFSTRYLPVPSAGTWQTWLAETAEAAREELRERLGATVRAMASKLADKDGVFRDSLVSNAAEVSALASDLNLTDDVDIAALAQATAGLASNDPETLRNNPHARAGAAARAAEICAAFNL